MANRFSIVGLGEALFDVFPHAQILGGAPLNVAVHANQMGQVGGGEGVVVARVGQDALGQRVRDELTQRGVNTGYLQTDPDRATGEVFVSVDQDGAPSYEIAADAAWDWLQFDPDLESLARRCEAICFGSLAQRVGQARNTIYRFLEAASRAFKLFDVNLRQSFYDRAVLDRSCALATAVKLNHLELAEVGQILGMTSSAGDDAAEADRLAAGLIKRYQLQLLVLTRGSEGTLLYTATERIEGKRVSYPQADQADSVGAGDACSAAILVAHALRMDMQRSVDLANHAGAYVASQAGGTPQLPQTILDLVKA
jgi:fructokinase